MTDLATRLAYPFTTTAVVTATTVQASSLAIARAVAEPAAGTMMALGGRTSVNDGGQGTFVWDATSTATDDGALTIAVSGVTTGRWKRVYSGPIDVRWFGAVGNGTTDDTAAIVAATAAASAAGGVVEIPTGSQRSIGYIQHASNVSLSGPNILQQDPGQPRILNAGLRSVRALTLDRRVMLNGFKAGGHYSKRVGPMCQLDHDSTYAYDYQTQVDSFGAPGLSGGSPEMWVAAFACRRPGETLATIRYVPYLKVTAWNAGTRTATFDAVAGTMATGGEWTGCDILACHESGLISWRQSTIASNAANTVTLAASGAWSLAAGDYLLPAPSLLADYKYLCSLKLDYSALLTPTYEWRNFAFGAGHQYGYTGNPFGDITSTAYTEIDFRGYVSPIAIGVLTSIQTYRTLGDDGSAYLYLSHDSSNHVIGQVGVDRTSVVNDGFSSPLPAGFGAKQSLWAKVGPDGNVVGRITILGGME